MSKILHVNVANKAATYQNRDGAIVCGNSDYLLEFSFDEEWAAYQKKTARFEWAGKYEDVEFEGDTCQVPVIKNTTKVFVGVYVGEEPEDESMLSSTRCEIPCNLSVRCGAPTAHDDTGENYTNEARGYAASAKESADRAEEAAEQAAIEAAENMNGGKILVDTLDGILKYGTLEEAQRNAGASKNAEILQALADADGSNNFIFGKGFYPFEKEFGLRADMCLEGVRDKTTLVFPNSKGLVTNKKGYFHKMYVKNLCISSRGHCIDFKNDGVDFPNSVYFSEFDGLDLYSDEGCCIYAGDNANCAGLDAMVFQCKFRNLFVGAPNGDGIYGVGGLGIVFENISDRYRTNAIFKNCYGTWYDCNTSFGYADYFLHIDEDAPQRYNAYIIMENVNMETLRVGGVFVEKLYYGHTMVKLRNVSMIVEPKLLSISDGEKISTHPLHFGTVNKDLIIQDVRYHILSDQSGAAVQWEDIYDVPESDISIHTVSTDCLNIADNVRIYDRTETAVQLYNDTIYTRSKSSENNVQNKYKTVPEMNIGYMHGTRGRIAYEVDMGTFTQSSVLRLGENSHCDGIVFKNTTEEKFVAGIQLSNYLRKNDGKTFYLRNDGTEIVQINPSSSYSKFINKEDDDTSWCFYLQPNSVIVYTIFYDSSKNQTNFIEISRHTIE